MVAIKDFDMPSCCGNCQMASCKGLSGQFYCDITTYDVDIDDTERDANCPLVEAIPKADYENRLKADLVAMLTDMLIDVEEIASREQWCDYANDNCISRYDVEDLIQKKIKALKENTDGTTSD